MSALKKNGQMWAWGVPVEYDGTGSNTVSYSSPVLVIGSYSFKSLANTGTYNLEGRIWLHKLAGVSNASIAKILGVGIDVVNKVAGV